VRHALLVVAIAVAMVARADGAPLSNPAFLGIGFTVSPIGCVIDTITADGPAANAGLRADDVLTSIDGTAITAGHSCQDVNVAITAHAPGDQIRIEVLRGGEQVVVHATLATRSEVLQRRVGQRMAATDLIGVDDHQHYDLGERKSRTLVVGVFDPNCAGCGHVVDHIADRLARRARANSAVSVLAVTSGDGSDADLAKLRPLTSTVPIAVADPHTYGDLSLADIDRVYFMVVDCRGIVQLVAPIAPDADDIDASADEVLAAADQAEHARTRR
jgi:PDZ domain-containing protein